MTYDSRPETLSAGWACAKCQGFQNQPEDRYCGECGLPRNVTIVTPVIRPPATSTSLLADVTEPRAPLLQGALHILLTGLAAAALFGALYHYVARSIDLKILFPILLGLGVGWALRVAAIRGRCHRAALLAGAAIAAGVAAYGVRQSLDTAQFRNVQHRRLAEEARDRDLIDGKKTVIVYRYSAALRDRAATGAAFNFGRLQGGWFWIFILVETALVAGVAAASVRSVSRHAYCRQCGEFIPRVSVYSANAPDADRLAEAVRRQKWKAAQEMTDLASAARNYRAEAVLLRCAGCNLSSIRVDVRAGRRSKRVMHVSLPPDSLESLARSA